MVIAGQGGAAKFIQEGTYKYIPYHKLFRRTEFMHIKGYGKFEAYANRDSLKYRTAYGLEKALTLYRGPRWGSLCSLRHHGLLVSDGLEVGDRASSRRVEIGSDILAS